MVYDVRSIRKIGLPAGTWSAWAATRSAAAASNLYSASTRGVLYLFSSSAKTGSASRSWPNVFAVGDTAAALAWNGMPVPGLAAAAKQQGHYVALVCERACAAVRRRRRSATGTAATWQQLGARA